MPAPLPEGDHPQQHADDVVVGGQVVEVDAGAADGAAQLLVARLGGFLEPTPEPRVAGVDEELLSGLGVLQDDHPRIDQADLARVPEAHRDDLVALREHPERPFPPRLADEIGEDEDQRPPADGGEPGPEEPAQIGDRARTGRLAQQVTGEPQDLPAPTPWLDDALDGVVVEHRADAVAVAA